MSSLPTPELPGAMPGTRLLPGFEAAPVVVPEPAPADPKPARTGHRQPDGRPGPLVIVSNSSRNLWTTCQSRYRFAVEECLTPVHEAPPLAFGTLWHRIMEAHYTGQAGDVPGMLDEWIKTKTTECGGKAGPELAEMAHMAGMLYRRWAAKYGQRDAGMWEPVAVESQFRLPIPTPKGNPSQGDITGSIDLVVRVLSGPEKGSLKLVEHKTTKMRTASDYEYTLMLDPQPRGYLWAARQQWENVTGAVCYNIVRKKLPTEPETLKCRPCKGTGWEKGVVDECPDCKGKGQVTDPLDGTIGPCGRCIGMGYNPRAGVQPCPVCNGTGVGGLSQRADMDSDVDTYMAALFRYPHLKVADYQDQLARLGSRPDGLWRIEKFVSDTQVQAWVDDTYRVVRDIARARHAGAPGYTHNYGACNAPGRACPFRTLCLGENPDARLEFKVRSGGVPGAPELVASSGETDAEEAGF